MNFKILFILIAFFCQFTNGKSLNVAPVKVSGKIVNPNDKYIVFNFNEKNDTFQLDSKNEFNGSLNIQQPAYGSIFYGGEFYSLYLSPGDDISLTLNTKEFDETIKYAGKGSDICNFLAQKYLFMEPFEMNFNELFQLKFKEFASTIDSIKMKLNVQLDEFLKKSKIKDKAFIDNEKIDILYRWAIYIIDYSSVHKYLTKDTFNNFSTCNDYIKDQITFKDTNLFQFYRYSHFIERYIYCYTSSLIGEDIAINNPDIYYNLKSVKKVNNYN